jgi:hypothetical protein
MSHESKGGGNHYGEDSLKRVSDLPLPYPKSTRIAGMGKNSAGIELAFHLFVAHTCHTGVVFLPCSKERYLWHDS